jgi:uncharacterized protein
VMKSCSAPFSSTMQSVYSYLVPLSTSHPMLPVLGLAALQVGMGAFDNIYHHELTERLPWRTSQIDEQRLHAARGALYTGVFASFAGLTPHGILAYGMAGILVIETGITLADFVTEDRTRLLPSTERVTHTLMTLNYGALLACWLPVLLCDWATLPTGIVFENYGIFSALNALCAVGVGAWSVRDWFAAKRLGVFAQEPLPALSLQQPRQRFLITGGTGLLGSRLIRCLLSEHHEVTVLVRDPIAAVRKFGSLCSKISIVTSLDHLQHPSEEVFDVVVNLAGAGIADTKWTAERKQELTDSRIQVTRDLNAFLRKLKKQPNVVLAGSAIGYYGVEPESTTSLTELDKPLSTDMFSQKLVAEWEETSMRASGSGKEGGAAPRVVLMRTGVVLSREGGALAKMLFPFELGLGGPVASGRQSMSWIHIDDWIRAVGKCINDQSLAGPVNFTSPHPVTSKEFANALGRALNRPAVIPLPGIVMRIGLGDELAIELLLSGSRIVPKRLLDSGFEFQYPGLDTAFPAVCSGVINYKK